MAREYYEQEAYYDQEIEFEYDGKTLYWSGDYTVTLWGETADWDNPGSSNSEVEIDFTSGLCYFDESTNVEVEIKPTNEILAQVEFEIYNHHF